MSQENIETLQASYAGFLRGDLDAAFAMLDQEIEVYDHDRILDTPKSYRGPQGVLQMAMEAAESFDEHRYEPEEFTDCGDQVLVAVRRKGRGKASGVEVDESQWHVWDFRDGKAIRFSVFVAKEAAVEAAGLLE